MSEREHFLVKAFAVLAVITVALGAYAVHMSRELTTATWQTETLKTTVEIFGQALRTCAAPSGVPPQYPDLSPAPMKGTVQVLALP
jgi:hypothetical protein